MNSAEHAPAYAMRDPGEIARFHDRCSDIVRAHLDSLAAAPEWPRTFGALPSADVRRASYAEVLPT